MHLRAYRWMHIAQTLLQPSWKLLRFCSVYSQSVLWFNTLDGRIYFVYISHMIRTLKDKRIAPLRAGKTPKGFPSDIADRARRRLAQLDAATGLEDLRVPPSNNLEALQGDRRGQYSIRINGQWRICFIWKEGDAHDVEIVDYH